jgi:glycosyltransferase involved in cell wall biosynthesis
MANPRILFITPAATRSGAPIVMLHLIRWLKQHADLEMSAVLLSDGAMAADFRELMPTQIFREYERPPVAILRWLRRRPIIARRRLAARVARCKMAVRDWPPDLVFCNSAVSAEVLDALGPFACPVLTSVHEMEHVLRSIDWIPGGTVMEVLARHTTHYIGCSVAVRDNLVVRHDVSANRVSVVYESIPTAEFRPRAGELSQATLALLKMLGIPEGARVIGSVATVEWRKGADLLVAMARELLRLDSEQPIHLVWIGGGTAAELAQLRFDITAAKLGDRVHAAGASINPADWYPAFSAFALLSREDPFPLVCLEAAASGVPIICFAGGGGIPEFVETDCGAIVPMLDLNAFANAAHRIVTDPALGVSLGQNAAAKVRVRHDVSVTGPLMLKCIEDALKSRRETQAS